MYFCNSPNVLIYTFTINVLLLVMPNTYLNLCLNSVILLLIPSWISVCLEYLLSLKMFVLLAWQTCENPDSPSPAITPLLPSDSLLLVWDVTSFQPLREPTSCPLNLSQHLAQEMSLGYVALPHPHPNTHTMYFTLLLSFLSTQYHWVVFYMTGQQDPPSLK